MQPTFPVPFTVLKSSLIYMISNIYSISYEKVYKISTLPSSPKKHISDLMMQEV